MIRTLNPLAPPRRILTPDEINQKPADWAMQGEWLAFLEAIYPGHLWRVTARSDQGVLNVWAGSVSDRYGVRIMLGKTDTPAEWKRAVTNAGGQLLERAGLPRGPRVSPLGQRANLDLTAAKG